MSQVFDAAAAKLKAVFAEVDAELLKQRSLASQIAALTTNRDELTSLLADLHKQIAAAQATLATEQAAARKIINDARIEAATMIGLAKDQARDIRAASQAKAAAFTAALAEHLQ